MEPERQTVLSRRRFDVDEYQAMMRAGVLREGARIELLDGEIVEMSPIGTRHVSCVARLHRSLERFLGDRAFVTSQGVVRLDRYSEPQPDVLVLRPRDDDYATHMPTPDDTLLLVEVADSSLPVDRGPKLAAYAAAGIREVWIVDLTNDVVEVYRDPGGGAYGLQRRVTGGVIGASALPDLELDVAAVLPPRTRPDSP